MSALRAHSSRRDPWRLLRLLLVLAVVLVLTALVSIEDALGMVPVPEAAFLPLLLAAGSAFAGLIVAAVRRGFRGAGVSWCFALALAASATAVWLPAIDAWSPSRWTVRALVPEALFGHWFTITTGTTLLFFLVLHRRRMQVGSYRCDHFGLEFLPLFVWALESTYNLDLLSHADHRVMLFEWYAEGMVAEVAALVVAILFVATTAHLQPPRRRPRGLFTALLAVTTALLDRAFALAAMVSAWAADNPAG